MRSIPERIGGSLSPAAVEISQERRRHIKLTPEEARGSAGIRSGWGRHKTSWRLILIWRR